MNIKNMLLTDQEDLRHGKIADKLSCDYDFNIKRNPNEKSLFKWYNSIRLDSTRHIIVKEQLVNITFCPIKSIIPINFRLIKEGLKNDKEMVFIFKDPENSKIYVWEYNEKQLIVNYNYNSSKKDIEYVSVFIKDMNVYD